MSKHRIGDKVQLNYCDDATVYEIDAVRTRSSGVGDIYHLVGAQGWKAEINIDEVTP